MKITQGVTHRKYAAILLLFLCFAVQSFAAEKPKYVVISPVVDMFSGPSTDTDVVSQAIYGSNVAALEENNGWVKIKTIDDDYSGWVQRNALLSLGDHAPYASSGNILEVRSLMAHLYREPDLTKHAPVLTVPFETHLELLDSKANSERWMQVTLADGTHAWIQQGDVTKVDPGATKPLDIPGMVNFSKQFLGLPYTWGGRSSFGYDCSGFVQMLMRRRGYMIPRDADVQAAWNGFAPVEVQNLQAGDVLFFGSKGNITHTGMYIGNGFFIHATTHDRPIIQISELNDYWKKLLVVQRRVKQ